MSKHIISELRHKERPDLSSVAAQEEDFDLLNVLMTLWRGRKLILLIMFLTILIGGYTAINKTPKYRATSSMILQVRTASVVNIESIISGITADELSINTELEIIQSNRVLGKLVDDLGLVEDPEFNSSLRPLSSYSMNSIRSQLRNMVSTYLGSVSESGPISEGELQEVVRNRTISALRNAVRAYNKVNTYMFLIEATTEDPRKSTLIANKLAEVYIDDQINVKFEATENAIAWLSERVVDLERDLAEKQDSIKNLRAGTDITTPEALEFLNQRVRDIENRQAEVLAEIALQEERVARLNTLKGSDDINEMAAAAQDPELESLLARDSAGDLKARQIFYDRFALLVRRAQDNLSRLQQQAAVLGNTMDQLQAEVLTKSEEFLRLQQLERESDATQALYETFLVRLKEASVQRGLQQADSRVLSEASTGYYVSPRKGRIMVFAVLVGLLLGSVVTLIRQFVYQGFRTVEDLERATDQTILGQVMKMPIRRRDQLITYLKNNPSSQTLESIRNLRTSILMSNLDNPPQIIMITSSVPAEGKTTVSISLAHNFAALGKSVLLVQGDLRRQHYSSYFSRAPKVADLSGNMTDYLKIEDIVFHDDEIGIDVLMGSSGKENAADVLSSKMFIDILESARRQYDHIIIDTPPVLAVPDALVIGRLVDALIVLVAWNRTSRYQISETLRSLETVGLRPNGLVFSQVDPRGMERYGYASSYGEYSKSYYSSR